MHDRFVSKHMSIPHQNLAPSLTKDAKEHWSSSIWNFHILIGFNIIINNISKLNVHWSILRQIFDPIC
jgi:hypothetical protein